MKSKYDKYIGSLVRDVNDNFFEESMYGLVLQSPLDRKYYRIYFWLFPEDSCHVEKKDLLKYFRIVAA